MPDGMLKNMALLSLLYQQIMSTTHRKETKRRWHFGD
jgi:hypothetical protein